MTNTEVVNIVRRHFESLFPKACSACGRRFETLGEYIALTQRLGPAVSYDAEAGDWKPAEPMGTLAYANCPCGSTLTLTTEGLAHDQRIALLTWLQSESARRSVPPSRVIEELRDEIRKQIMEGGQSAAS